RQNALGFRGDKSPTSPTPCFCFVSISSERASRQLRIRCHSKTPHMRRDLWVEFFCWMRMTSWNCLSGSKEFLMERLFGRKQPNSDRSSATEIVQRILNARTFVMLSLVHIYGWLHERTYKICASGNQTIRSRAIFKIPAIL